MCCSPCKWCCPNCCCFLYTDTEFEGPSAIGSNAYGEITWVRAEVLLKNPKPPGFCDSGTKMRLFEQGDSDRAVEPGDIKQGSLGDCWLLGAFAAFSEVPGGLQNLFVNREASEKGKYTIRIYCSIEKRWTEVTIDDRIPIVSKSLQDGY